MVTSDVVTATATAEAITHPSVNNASSVGEEAKVQDAATADAILLVSGQRGIITSSDLLTLLDCVGNFRIQASMFTARAAYSADGYGADNCRRSYIAHMA
jgi:hypothetical protein